CNLSKSHFMKLFKNITGKGFNEFLIEHRLHMASLMLKNTDDKLIDVSVNCGFENQSYFTRCFTKHFKMTPSQFRRKNLNQH
ncbi:MAG: helix-turn-helix transcriptional regulator, partial [Succinivibrio sp.]|nr:helix-turn-helix transcriptional regulator [Succinivibrio sp.]